METSKVQIKNYNTIHILFPINLDIKWMGGVNYYKNLFTAIKMLNEKSSDNILLIYINEPNDENLNQIFSNYASYTKKEVYKPFKYYYKKFYKKLLGKEFQKEKYIKYKKYDKFDITSHNQNDFIENVPALSWIPDFQHICLPEMFSQKEIIDRDHMFIKQIEKARLLILSSEDAKKDLEKFSPNNVNKARVLHFVADIDPEVYKKTDEIKSFMIEKYDLPEKYFYVPNQFWKHKNHKVVFEAINELKKNGTDINVVFTGYSADYRHQNHFNDLMNYAKENNIEGNIKILGLVEPLEVYYLMRNCISIINPSLFEGWSTTVEEAKSLGKNIILSNINVHKEQNPPQGIYFDPYNPCELADILKDKWLNKASAPDYELEDIAKANMKNRMLEFANNYKNIVLEALKQ